MKILSKQYFQKNATPGRVIPIINKKLMYLDQEVYEKLSITFDDSIDKIEFEDMDGAGRHFRLKIISEKFEGKNRIKRSQMVYELLDELIKSDRLHALKMTLKTPEELMK